MLATIDKVECTGWYRVICMRNPETCKVDDLDDNPRRVKRGS
jgi:hypothetical protein